MEAKYGSRRTPRWRTSGRVASSYRMRHVSSAPVWWRILTRPCPQDSAHQASSGQYVPLAGAARHGFGIVNYVQPDTNGSRIGGLVAGEDFQPVHSDPRKDWMRGGMTALRCVYDGCKFVNRSRSPSRLDAAGWSSGIVRNPMVNSFQKHRECFARFSKVCDTNGTDGRLGLIVPCWAWML